MEGNTCYNLSILTCLTLHIISHSSYPPDKLWVFWMFVWLHNVLLMWWWKSVNLCICLFIYLSSIYLSLSIHPSIFLSICITIIFIIPNLMGWIMYTVCAASPTHPQPMTCVLKWIKDFHSRILLTFPCSNDGNHVRKFRWQSWSLKYQKGWRLIVFLPEVEITYHIYLQDY